MSVALTAAGVGGSVMATHQLAGVTFRTFSEPLPRVREAALEALQRMGVGSEQPAGWPDELIQAWAGDRAIEIELEAVTPATTRMKVVVRKDGGFLVDGATALEIVNQTAKLLPAR